MPIFEYKCAECGTKFEKIILSASAREQVESELTCPSCGKQHFDRELSTFAAHAKGASGAPALPMCPSGGVCRTPGACGLN